MVSSATCHFVMYSFLYMTIFVLPQMKYSSSGHILPLRFFSIKLDNNLKFRLVMLIRYIRYKEIYRFREWRDYDILLISTNILLGFNTYRKMNEFLPESKLCVKWHACKSYV